MIYAKRNQIGFPIKHVRNDTWKMIEAYFFANAGKKSR